MKYLIIILSTILVNNVIFSQFLGICPFLGTSKKTSTALGMGAAVIFVLTLATLVTWLTNQYILIPLNLTFLQTIAFILIIAALVQMVEIILKKISPSLYTALGVFLPFLLLRGGWSLWRVVDNVFIVKDDDVVFDNSLLLRFHRLGILLFDGSILLFGLRLCRRLRLGLALRTLCWQNQFFLHGSSGGNGSPLCLILRSAHWRRTIRIMDVVTL